MKNIIATIAFLFLFTSPIYSHSGRTDSSGCHNCNVGSCAGTYHCHNGGGSYGGYVAPVTPKNPVGQGYTTLYPHFEEALFDVKMDWADTSALSYSIAISKTPGANPGPNPDTASSEFTFTNVPAGKWYVNVKANVGGTWSEIVYWTIEVPNWVKPTPTPTPTTYRYPTPYQTAYTNTATSDNSDNIVWVFLAGVLAVFSLILGWITNLINRPNHEDKRLVKEIMKVTEEVYSKDRSRMVTSPEYLNWDSRSDTVDDMVCANMGITAYQYSSLIKRKSVKLLYKKLVNARERASTKTDNSWYEKLTAPFMNGIEWITQKAEENVFYAIVFYPLSMVISLVIMGIVMVGFSVVPLVMFSPLYVIFMYEEIGWPLVILYYLLLVVGYLWWTNREKK